MRPSKQIDVDSWWRVLIAAFLRCPPEIQLKMRKRHALSPSDLLMIYKFPCCWPPRPAPGGANKAAHRELAAPSPLDRMAAHNAPRRHAPVRNSPGQAHIFARSPFWCMCDGNSRPFFDARRPMVCSVAFFDSGIRGLAGLSPGSRARKASLTPPPFRFQRGSLAALFSS